MAAFILQRFLGKCRSKSVIVIYLRPNVQKFFFFIKNFFKFIYLERESMSTGEAEREGKRESQAGSTLSAHSLTWASISQTVR